MIAFLRGRLAAVGADAVIVDVGGVGYRVEVPTSVRAALPALGAECTLHTHLAVREDAMTLYGFATANELDLFEALITVNGVGPKVALAILSVLSPEACRRAIVLGDHKALQAAPGVGQKLAQRLVLELKGRFGSVAAAAEAAATKLTAADAADGTATVVAALVSLGFSRAEAVAALDRVRGTAPAAGPEELVRLCLQQLGKA